MVVEEKAGPVTAGTLSATVAANSDHVVCFDRDGREHLWPEMAASAGAVRAAVTGAGGQHWAINLDDTREFASALLGCWAAGKTPVLVSQTLLESADLQIDGVLQANDGEARDRTLIPWHSLPTSSGLPVGLPPSAEVVLYTSGSTGAPKQVRRRVQNVEAELAILEKLWGTQLGDCRVHSTVSHRHVYGMLFRVLWPLVNRRPFATFDLEYPEQLVDGRGKGQTLISSPALLKRVGHLTSKPDAWRVVFSSGGLLTRDAATDSKRVLGVCPIEVLGSTETSGVAWRQQADADADATEWNTMPPVETRASADGFLEVRSPFTGHADWLRMGDMVRPTTVGRFELLGRGDHLAKIEDKRVSLAEIELNLAEHPWVRDAAAVAIEDATRQYIGVVVQLSEAGNVELEQRGRLALNNILRKTLRGRIEAIALPRKFRYVCEIPMDSQGKRQPHKLKELFEQPWR